MNNFNMIYRILEYQQESSIMQKAASLAKGVADVIS